MYEKIDELVKAIKKDDLFQAYCKSHIAMKNEKTLALLSRHQRIQDDYMQMKRYEKYASCDELKKSLKEVKKEVLDDQYVNQYYKDYRALNALLEEVTHIVFSSISDDLVVEQWKL